MTVAAAPEGLDPMATARLAAAPRIAIVGNAGSGKSTLARALAANPPTRPRLDLDSIFWEPDAAAQPRPAAAVQADLARFAADHPRWVIEGCYGELVQAVLAWRPLLILLDPGVETCLAQCRARPWEPAKFASRAEQDAQLEPLLAWVADYEQRDGTMSRRGHEALLAAYEGPRLRLPHRGPPPPLVDILRDLDQGCAER